MCPTMKLLFISLLLAGVAVVSSTNGRTKRYAQEPQQSQGLGSNPSPLQSIFTGISDRFQSLINRLENRYSTGNNPLSNLISGIGQQRNGSMLLDGLLRRMSAIWNQRPSNPNATFSSQNFQLLRDLLQLRNASPANERSGIDGLLLRILSDLNQRLASSNMTVPSQILQELRGFISRGIGRHQNATQDLQRLLIWIHSIMSERYYELGRTSPGSPRTSGDGPVPSGNPQTSGEGSLSTSGRSGSASGSAESGSRSGSLSSGSGESGDAS